MKSHAVRPESPLAQHLHRPPTPTPPHPDKKQPYVCVYASQVAMCIGANRHKKVSDAVVLMWQRICPSSFREAMRRNNLKTEEDALQDILESSQEVRALVDKSKATTGATSAEVAAVYSGAAGHLAHAGLDDTERQLVDAALRKNLYTAYGTHAEPEMLRHIRDVMCIPCHADPTFYKLHMGEVDGVPWYVGGKIDALSDDGHLLIEIKNRVNRLFYRAPAYEAVQVQTYLELLDVHQGALVECFKGDSGGVQTNVIPIARDKAFWKHEVVPKLHKFVGFLIKLLRDPATQDTFLKSKRPSSLVANFTPPTGQLKPQASSPEANKPEANKMSGGIIT